MKRNDLCNVGSVFVGDKEYKLLRYEENDKVLYIQMLNEIFYKNKEYLESSFFEESWNEILNDDDKLALKIIDIKKDIYVGEVTIQNIQSDCAEISIYIMKEHRNKGIAGRILPLFIDKIKSLVEVEYYLARIMSNNLVSIKIFEELGAVKIGEERTEYITYMNKLVETWGREKIEETVGKSLEEIMAYVICYAIYR